MPSPSAREMRSGPSLRASRRGGADRRRPPDLRRHPVGRGPRRHRDGPRAPADGTTPVRIRAVGTGARTDAVVRTPGGAVAHDGDTAVAGVPGDGRAHRARRSGHRGPGHRRAPADGGRDRPARRDLHGRSHAGRDRPRRRPGPREPRGRREDRRGPRPPGPAGGRPPRGRGAGLRGGVRLAEARLPRPRPPRRHGRGALRDAPGCPPVDGRDRRAMHRRLPARPRGRGRRAGGGPHRRLARRRAHRASVAHHRRHRQLKCGPRRHRHARRGRRADRLPPRARRGARAAPHPGRGQERHDGPPDGPRARDSRPPRPRRPLGRQADLLGAAGRRERLPGHPPDAAWHPPRHRPPRTRRRRRRDRLGARDRPLGARHRDSRPGPDAARDRTAGAARARVPTAVFAGEAPIGAPRHDRAIDRAPFVVAAGDACPPPRHAGPMAKGCATRSSRRGRGASPSSSACPSAS